MGPTSRIQTPPRPLNESERLKALRELQILDSGADATFDRIVQLAAKIFDAPLALIGFIDKERQWFKAKIGLKAEQVPRDHAVCSYTILQKSVMVVCDTTRDDRFAKNPALLDQGLRFYAGAQLTSSLGHAVGTLCILDTKPRDAFSEREVGILSSLAKMVSQAMEVPRQQAGTFSKDLQKHALVAMTTMDGVWDWDLTQKVAYFSPRCQTLLGLPAIDKVASPQYWFERIHPDDLRDLRRQFFQHIRRRAATFDAEHRVRYGDGRWR